MIQLFIFHTFHVVQREMISNNINLSFCNQVEKYIEKDQQIVIEQLIYD
jgi:hypothetical protein